MSKLNIMRENGFIKKVYSNEYFTTRIAGTHYEYMNDVNRVLIPFTDDESSYSIIISNEKWNYISKTAYNYILRKEEEWKLKCEHEGITYHPRYFSHKQGDEHILIVISDRLQEIIDAIIEDLRYEDAYKRQVKRYKNLFSLDTDIDIENAVLIRASNEPEIALALKEQHCALCCALNSLTEAQGSRIEAYYINGITQRNIAKIQGVNERSVRESINTGLKKMNIFIKNFEKYPPTTPDFCPYI